MLRRVFASLVLFTAFAFACQRTSAATVTLQSAEMGFVNQGAGQSLSATSFIGWRFELTQTFRISQVGGHLRGISDQLFAAIVSLSSATALPQGAPFTVDEVKAKTALTPPIPSDQIMVPLPVILPKGHYALVFGAGQFNIPGTGLFPNSGQPLIAPTTSASFISWRQSLPGQQEWLSGGLTGLRFVVTGSPLAGPTDFNLDGAIDGADLAVWKPNFGAGSTPGIPQGNADEDADVDGADFLQWQRTVARTAGATPAAVAVPEPRAILIALVAAVIASLTVFRCRAR